MLNLSSATISEYEGSNAQCITIPVSKNLTYATYLVADELIDVELFIEITKSNNIYTVKYYDLDKNEIGGLSVNNGIVYNAYGIIESGSSSRFNSFGSKWGNCVKANLNRMSDGSIGGSVYGLGCMVFGAQCAGGIAAGCAFRAMM